MRLSSARIALWSLIALLGLTVSGCSTVPEATPPSCPEAPVILTEPGLPPVLLTQPRLSLTEIRRLWISDRVALADEVRKREALVEWLASRCSWSLPSKAGASTPGSIPETFRLSRPALSDR